MLSLSYIGQQIVNGLNQGSIYALVAIGLTSVYGILRLINFAHGDLLMGGAYLGLVLLLHSALPLGAVVLVPMIVVGGAGILVERLAYRPLRGAPEVAMLITSLAVSSILQNGTVMTLTAQPRAFRLPSGFTTLHQVGGISFSTVNVMTVGLA